jgi:hypothetical protein
MVGDGTITLEELKHMIRNLREAGLADFQNIWEKHCLVGKSIQSKRGPFL